MILIFFGLISSVIFLFLYQSARKSAMSTGNHMAFQDNAWGWPTFVDRDFGRITMILAGIDLAISMSLFALSGLVLPWQYSVGAFLIVLGFIAHWIGIQKRSVTIVNRLILLGATMSLIGMVVLSTVK